MNGWTRTNRWMYALSLAAAGAALACTHPQHSASPGHGQRDETETNWRDAERGVLENQVQLTFPEQFVKAGEAYFSPDDSKVIFQAVERPEDGSEPDEFYAMFVADVARDDSGAITGLNNITRISPDGSANTCGWFHPTERDVVLFGSTIVPPTDDSPEHQRDDSRYKWAFPQQMRIVRCNLNEADGTAEPLTVLVGDGDAYHAEGSWSNDGRHILYCSRESGEGDIYALDTKTGTESLLVDADGYDGGPFFSPDGRRICYRSDRRGDEKLQLFVADLEFNEAGTITGIEREYQLTNDDNVNWCPYWTPDGKHLVYSTSALGHTNYEIFWCDADGGDPSSGTPTLRYGTGRKRITHGPKADVLPVFSHDGRWLMWTSQRHDRASSQLWAARFVFESGQPAAVLADDDLPELPDHMLHVQDPDSGIYYIYNRRTHELTAYDLKSHETRPVTDPAEMERASELFDQKTRN